MANLIVAEGGKSITVATDYDISTASTVTLKRVSPTDVASNISMTIGIADIDVPGYGMLLAGFYAQYVIGVTDFTEAGRWRLQIHADFGGGTILKSDEIMIVVGPSL